MYDQSRFSDAERKVRSTTLLPGLRDDSCAADGVVAVWTAGGAGEAAGAAAGACAGGVAWAVAMAPAIRARAKASGRASRRMANRVRRGAGYRSSGA
ncbi:hypothetical protein BCEN4_40089 [Burkholderia cenocepacia]|nr:hypothetical protein BCEN4_40089 [Burkholderia cenocepacia]